MKIIYTKSFQILILILIAFNIINAKNTKRYLSPVFDDVVVIKDVIYGKHKNNYKLRMDIYLPKGDHLNKRPAIIFAHGGAFVIGDKNDATIRELCKEFARRGYVTVSINYRLARYPSLLKMGYQAVQDGKAAVRFVRHKANTYGIDPNYIFFGGISAGSIIALNVAFLEDNENMAGRDFYNRFGCLNCTGNNYNESSKVSGVINICGGVLDLLHIDRNENIPVISFHGTNDKVISIDRGLPFKEYMSQYNSIAKFIHPMAPMEPIYGSRKIHDRLNYLNIQNQLIMLPGKGHKLLFDEYSQTLDSYFTIIEKTENFVFNLMRPPTPKVNGVKKVNTLVAYHYSVKNPSNLRVNWAVKGGKIINKTNKYIEVKWENISNPKLSVAFLNNLGILGESTELKVKIPIQANNKITEIVKKDKKKNFNQIKEKSKYLISNFISEIKLKKSSSIFMLIIASIMIFFGLKKPN